MRKPSGGVPFCEKDEPFPAKSVEVGLEGSGRPASFRPDIDPLPSIGSSTSCRAWSETPVSSTSRGFLTRFYSRTHDLLARLVLLLDESDLPSSKATDGSHAGSHGAHAIWRAKLAVSRSLSSELDAYHSRKTPLPTPVATPRGRWAT